MKTILVVDDVAIVREPIEAALRAEGFRVLTAADGAEALKVISYQRPDLILLDLGLPVMDGLQVLREVRERAQSKTIPVIILSAAADRLKIEEAAKLGISGYLLKTQFSMSAMHERVQKALATSVPSTSESTSIPVEAHPIVPATTVAVPIIPGLLVPSPRSKLGTDRNTARSKPERTLQPMDQREHASAARPASPVDAKSLRPLMTRSEVFERLTAEEELKGFSPTVTQVLKITSSPKCSVEQVAKAVSQDQGLALKILKIANSSIHSRGDRVDTVHKAVLRIGLECIRQTALNIGVVERFSSIAFEQHLNTAQFWEHSIATGIIAADIAHALRQKQADIAFTAGLLHDLGRILFAERLGETYVRVLETARAMELPLEQVESRMLLASHAEVMSNVLRLWKFPKDLIDPIVFHHRDPADVKGVTPHQAVDVLRLQLADRLAHAMMLGSSGNDTIYPTDEVCRLLGVQPATIRQIEDTARQQTDDTKFALISGSNSAAWPRRVEQHRALLRAPTRPLFVSASPEIDAYRIFCDELFGRNTQSAPGFAVAHITRAADRVPLSSRLSSEETRLGTPGLPLIVLSPDGELTLENAVIERRDSRLLATPITVERFVSTVNTLVGGARRSVAA